MMVPLAPLSPSGIHDSVDETVVVFAYAVGLLITAPSITHLTRRRSFQQKMLLATTLLGLALCLIGCTTHFWVYVSGRVLQGMSSAIVCVVGYAAVVTLNPAKSMAMLGFVLAAGSAGFITGPALGGWLFDIRGYHYPFCCLCLILAVFAVVQWWSLADYLPARSASKTASKTAPPFALASPSKRHNTRRRTIYLSLCSISVWPALLAAFTAMSWVTLEAFVPIKLYQEYAETPQGVGTLFSLASLLSFLASTVVAFIALSTGKAAAPWFATLGLMLMSAGFLLMAIYPSEHTVWLGVSICSVAYTVLVYAITASFGDLGNVHIKQLAHDAYERAYAGYAISYATGYSIGSGLEYLCASFMSFKSVMICMSCLFAILLSLAFRKLLK